MRHNSTVLKVAFLFMTGSAAITYAQVNPEVQDSIATDSADWEQDVLLSETVIVGKGVIDLEEERKTPVAASTILKQEIQDKAVGNVEFPEVIKNTPSVYIAGQAGGFGDSSIRMRGFDQSNIAVMLNGQPVNAMEDGIVYWSNWSSMTDVANAVQVQRGLGASKLAISSVGGTINIVTKATEKQQGGMARFVMGNDSYMKGTVAYDTGLKGKWGFSVLLDYWSGHRKFARGTAGEGQSYFFSVGFKPNDHHNLNFLIFGAPQWHDQNYATKSESQWAAGNNDKKYNNTYGFLNGEAMNWRRNYYHKPVANLNWDWNINSNASLSTVIYASLGRGGGTGTLGNNTGLLNDLGEADFTSIYNQNLADPDGVGNNGGAYPVGSPYYNSNPDQNGVKNGALRSSVNNHLWYGAVTNFNYTIGENWSFNVGGDFRFYKGDHFRQLVDLFGLSGWQDRKRYEGAESFIATETFEADPWQALFNFANEDQRIAYDNSEKINYQGGFGQVEFSASGFSAFVQGAVSNQSYQAFNRWYYEGEAKSEKVNKLGYNVKGGLGYNFLGAHTIFGNAGFYSRQPFLVNIFVPNTVDLYEPEVDNEEITGFEVGYRYDTRNLKINVNLYHTKWANRFEEASGQYNGEDVAYLYPNVTQVHKGIEIDISAKLARKWTLKGYGSIGDWQYDGTTPVRVRDADFNLTSISDIDLSGVKVGDAAQFTFGMGTAFEPMKGLSFDADLNYYARIYGSVDPLAVIDAASSGEDYAETTIAPYALMDAGITYEFKFGTQKLRFRGNVKNLLNTQYIIAVDGFGYGYGLGRTYNAGIQYSF